MIKTTIPRFQSQRHRRIKILKGESLFLCRALTFYTLII